MQSRTKLNYELSCTCTFFFYFFSLSVKSSSIRCSKNLDSNWKEGAAWVITIKNGAGLTGMGAITESGVIPR